MHHLDLGLFNYQVIYMREMLKESYGQIAINDLDNRLAKILRFPGLKLFKNGLENIKRFTANEYQNMIKVFLFIVEGLIIKHHKESLSEHQAKQADNLLVNVYFTGIKCICTVDESIF